MFLMFLNVSYLKVISCCTEQIAKLRQYIFLIEKRSIVG